MRCFLILIVVLAPIQAGAEDGEACRACLGIDRELWQRAKSRLALEAHKATCGPFKFHPNDPPLNETRRKICKARAQVQIDRLKVPDDVYGEYVDCMMLGPRWRTVYKTCK